MLMFMPFVGLHTGLTGVLRVRGGCSACCHHLLGPGCRRGGALQVHDRVPHHLQRHAAAHVLPVGRALSLERAPHWLQIAAHADPVAYAVDLMRGALIGSTYFPVWLSLTVLACFIAVMTWLATRIFTTGEDA